ncbi:lysylphosphatidylglycerol synthase transmembrane domain-containing protein [Halomarina rubra]|uniref:YbhN family protein n=1 Tax=Halomarina rubra TaxID=2071873 RepID=A0ABD6AQ23_9EURY|nr:lysylphosphatidylglycerol synthase domain-containing protein [Halomarina rubra]
MGALVQRFGGVVGPRRVAAVGGVALAAVVVAVAGPFSLPPGVDARTVGLMLGLAFVALTCRGIALRGVLDILGTRVGRLRAVGLFFATTFVGCLAPFGKAAAGPVSGLLVSSATDTEYEQSLAAVVTVDAVVSAVGLGLALAGLGGSTRPDSSALLALPVLAVLGVLAWRFRDRLVGAAGRVVAVPVRLVCRVLPSKTPPSTESVTERVERVVASVELVARSPRRLAGVVAIVALGQVAAAACLWLALDAVGSAVSFPLVLGVLPLAGVGTLVPSPGGAAGVEAALVGLLVSFAGVAVPPASAAVLLYRTATFWAPLPVGGLSTLALGGREAISAARSTADGVA